MSRKDTKRTVHMASSRRLDGTSLEVGGILEEIPARLGKWGAIAAVIDRLAFASGMISEDLLPDALGRAAKKHVEVGG